MKFHIWQKWMLGGIGFGVLSPENDTRQQVSGVYQQHLSTIIEKYSQTLTLLHKFRKLASARRKHLSIKLTNCRFKALRWKKNTRTNTVPTLFWLTGCALSSLNCSLLFFREKKYNSKYKSKHVLSSILFFEVGKYFSFASSSSSFGGEQADSGFANVLSLRL